MEYEDLHNKVKADQSAAILVLKTVFLCLHNLLQLATVKSPTVKWI